MQVCEMQIDNVFYIAKYSKERYAIMNEPQFISAHSEERQRVYNWL